MKNKKIAFIPYVLVFIGVIVVLILRFTGILKIFDTNCVYLILMLAILAVIPQFKKITVKGIELEKNSSIKSADSTEIENDEKEDEEEFKNLISKDNIKEKSISVKAIKDGILSQYCKENNINQNEILYNRQIVVTNNQINTINPIFSWYLKKSFSDEYLLESKFTSINSSYYNKLYVMISKIFAYNDASSKRLKLLLLIKKYDPETNIGVKDSEIEELKDVFQPSIETNLLEIKVLDIKLV